jgi:hypothetical protein
VTLLDERVEQGATPTDVASQALAAVGVGSSEWLQISTGPHLPSGTWTTLARLLAVDGDGRPGAGLAAIVAATCRTRPDLDAELVWSTVHTGTLWGLAEVNARLFATSERIVRFDPADLRVKVVLTGDEPGVRGVHFPSLRLAVGPDDPLAGDPTVGVGPPDDLLAGAVRAFADLAEPFVEAVRGRVSVGRRGLWGNLVDCFAFPLGNRRPGDRSPVDQHDRTARFERAAMGTPLGQRLAWIDFEHRGEPHTTLVTTTCCLAYKWPDDGHVRQDGCDPRWNRYCMSCPLIPSEETVHRARYWLDHPDG